MSSKAIFPRVSRMCLFTGIVLSCFLLLLQTFWVLQSPKSQMLQNPKSQLLQKNGLSDEMAVQRLKVAIHKLEVLATKMQSFNVTDILKKLDKLESSFDKVQQMESQWLNVMQLMTKDLQHLPKTVGGRTQGKVNTALNQLLHHRASKRTSHCEVPNDPAFPYCRGKVEFLRASWQSDPCYAFYGVEGSDCSILRYLSETEYFCPPLPGRNLTENVEADRKNKTPKASLTTDLSSLLELIGTKNNKDQYNQMSAESFMSARIQRLSARWTKAVKRLQQKNAGSPTHERKILVYPGVLSDKAGGGLQAMVGKGGPLGELVQWADIMAALHILGHHVTIRYFLSELQRLIGSPPGKGSCPIQGPFPFDIVYTDYHGLAQLQSIMGPSFKEYKCRFHVIDSFGTEPAYNHREYANKHGFQTIWGSWNLRPQQYMTMFPHTPDNSFMGFVSEELEESQRQVVQAEKVNTMAVVYGKQDFMWQGKEQYLDAIARLMEIHGTVYHEAGKKPQIPNFIINHGLLSQNEVLKLLRKAKLFIGLGFPYEGPAPLEAIALGCVFIQPRFKPAHSSLNTDFYKGKPTSREVTSQHPYAEHHIGKPYVWTVDSNNVTEIAEAVKKILQTKVRPYTPYEYSCEGMLERVRAYITHQDFCSDPPPTWPPLSTLIRKLGYPNDSCIRTCQRHNMICEPALFYQMNTVQAFNSLGIPCEKTLMEGTHLLPAFHINTHHCHLQKDDLLFSCAGSEMRYRRLCPCRKFQEGQTALCEGCF
ncbi:alpha-1,6-mannosylglycoprotein 6-beta-N-acetylglucosaminyltransferase B-like isoform X2 [Protopterus annectens]|nr:alpha-1,6-mannosylglycoprotein 6-beta-N-acetylglucosaminyltransferase B-like isoform X2 [Protopterus annectens]XP_043945187.1 alpha-1,6-mannosylglycoprotein 6-beta-N-acetylglucosaminyltransferase B-like isoform X2 [Protopterus annectens]